MFSALRGSLYLQLLEAFNGLHVFLSRKYRRENISLSLSPMSKLHLWREWFLNIKPDAPRSLWQTFRFSFLSPHTTLLEKFLTAVVSILTALSSERASSHQSSINNLSPSLTAHGI